MSDFNLGTVTAYGYAKDKGYTGTEDEFAALMASYADVAEQAAESAEQAAASATTATTKASEASDSASAASASKTAAQNAQSSAESAATTATTKASEASNSASTAMTKAGEATTAAGTATTAATSAAGSATTATTKAGEAATSATTAAEAAQRAEDAAATLVIDDTLTHAGQAADAKKTGDEIGDLKDGLPYKTAVSINLTQLNIKKMFPISQGDTVKIYTVDGSLFTPTAIEVYDKKLNKLGNITLSGYGVSSRVVTMSYSDAMFICPAGGTAQDIIVERINVNAISDLDKGALINSCVNTVLDTLDEYVPFYIPQGHTVIVTNEEAIFTPTNLKLYDNNKVQIGSFSLSGWGVNARYVSPDSDAYYASISGGTAQKITVYDCDSNLAEYVNRNFNDIRQDSIYSTVVSALNTITPFYANLNDTITFRSVNMSAMTPSYIYLYDVALKQLGYYGLSGWGTIRSIQNDRGEVRYCRLVGGTAQAIEVVNGSQQKADIALKSLAAIYDYPTNVSNIDTSTAIATFEANVSTNTNNESFIFFTDPHTLRQNPAPIEETYYLLSFIKKFYDSSSAEFVISGGDWLQDNDSVDDARTKLAYAVGHCNGMINPCYQIVGNHDTNYQGSGVIDNGQIENIMNRQHKKNYYSFDGHSSTFYVLDSGVEKSELSAYDLGQIAWLCSALTTNTKEFLVICIHIFWTNAEYTLSVWGSALTNIVNAFNARGTYTSGGVTYNFGSATGKIEFVLTGHTHADMSQVLDSGVPVVGTINAGYEHYAFDMINADFDAKTLNITRVGAGSSRTFELP